MIGLMTTGAGAAATTPPRVSRRAGVPGRRYTHFGALDLELGGQLPEVTVAYETYGTLNRAGDNAVLVLHALTGDAHAVGEADAGNVTPGWWDAVVGPGRAIDTNRWFVVSSNVLGGCQGTTGPSSLAPDGRAYGSRFPRVTIRDQVRVEAMLADYLGVERFALVAGGSMGGMRALEWCLLYPDRVEAAWVSASSAYATADQIGLQTAQIQIIANDPDWHGGDYAEHGAVPLAGMGLARRVAHLSYRTEQELAVRFGRSAQEDEQPLGAATVGEAYGVGVEHRYAVQSYLDHHGDKIGGRFDPGTYVTLTDAMNTHDVGRGRGGVEAALASISVPMVVSGIDSDRLYPLYLQQQIADLVPSSGPLRVIESPYGHDGFLLESDAIGEQLGEALQLVVGHRPTDAHCA